MPIYSATQLYVTHNRAKLSVIVGTLDNFVWMLQASEYLNVEWIMLRIRIFWVVMFSIRAVDSRRFEGPCRFRLEGFLAEIF